MELVANAGRSTRRAEKVRTSVYCGGRRPHCVPCVRGIFASETAQTLRRTGPNEPRPVDMVHEAKNRRLMGLALPILNEIYRTPGINSYNPIGVVSRELSFF